MEATRPCWLGAWRAARGALFAWPSGLRGRGSAGAAPAGPCCRPRPAASAAWLSAGGCGRPRSPCGCPAPARGPTARARGRQPAAGGGGAAAQAPSARWVPASAASSVRAREGRRDAGDGLGALSRHSPGVLGSYGQPGRSILVNFRGPPPGTVSGQVETHCNPLVCTPVAGRCVYTLHR